MYCSHGQHLAYCASGTRSHHRNQGEKAKRRKLHTLESRLIVISEVRRQRELSEAELAARPDLDTTQVVYTTDTDTENYVVGSVVNLATTVDDSSTKHLDQSSATLSKTPSASSEIIDGSLDAAPEEEPVRPAALPRLDVAWKMQLGTWVKPYLEDANRQLAYLVQKALRYDPVRQYWVKRLARYIILNLAFHDE